MALTIEDGTGVAGATSYVSLDEAKAYALARGAAFSIPDADLEVLLVRATDYLEAQRRRYAGTKTNGAGYLQWPRTGASVDGVALDATEIPGELKLAQCQLAIEFRSVDPLKSATGPAVKQRTVGPITTVYAIGDNATAPARMPKVEALLEPLYRSSGSLTVERA